MENSIGQLDKLIEQKVDNKIREFSKSLTDQITKFLKDNGDSHGEYLYVIKDWDKNNNGNYIPLTHSHQSIYQVQIGLVHGLSITIKDKMITKESKELLDKVKLLG
jgi:hypothetical protein